jgi:hypothetical protein
LIFFFKKFIYKNIGPIGPLDNFIHSDSDLRNKNGRIIRFSDNNNPRYAIASDFEETCFRPRINSDFGFNFFFLNNFLILIFFIFFFF